MLRSSSDFTTSRYETLIPSKIPPHHPLKAEDQP